MKLDVKISVKGLDKIKTKMDQFVDSSFIGDVQSVVVDGQVKRLIQSGQSPVEGFGRFVQYKDKDTYPAGEKPASPANLTLSGRMLKALTAWRVNGKQFAIGIAKGASDQIKERAEGNNLGTGALKGKKLNRDARRRIRDQNLPLARAARGGKTKRTLQAIVRGNVGVPPRRFIPIGNEQFTVSVIRAIKNLCAKRLRKLLSK